MIETFKEKVLIKLKEEEKFYLNNINNAANEESRVFWTAAHKAFSTAITIVEKEPYTDFQVPSQVLKKMNEEIGIENVGVKNPEDSPF